MSFDMSQFYGVFFEETEEHLANMESLLLEIDRDAPDAEQLNAIFRAAHSIKGSSATFGFSDLADVTHALESLLDGLRKGDVALSAAMVETFLEAGDVLKAMVAAHRGEGESDPAAARLMSERLESLGHEARSREPGAMSCAYEQPGHAIASLAQSVSTTFRVVFVPDPVAAGSPRVLDNLLAELCGLGKVEIVFRPLENDLTTPWQLLVTTEADLGTLDSLLDFVALSGSVSIAAESAAGRRRDHQQDTNEAYLAQSPAPLHEAYGFFDDSFIDPPAATALKAYGPSDAGESKNSNQHAVSGTKQREVQPEVKSAGETGSIRVGVEKVDQMINLVGELVITQAMLAQAASSIDPVLHERLLNGLAQLERNTRDLQESVMSMRMTPISVVFSRFPRVVHDVSRKLGKQVELKVSGENTELDKSLVERIADPLTHMVRNSIDHGIEPPEGRTALGKDPVGTITLKASHHGGNIVIEVGDDGAGLDRHKIVAKARERGLGVTDSMSDEQVWQLIFEAGFSTADKVTDVSGRGVGMDVVKRNVAAMGGRVEIDSVKGLGTRMTMHLPLTLAILDGMSVAVGGEIYVLPLDAVVESLQPTRAMIKSLNGVERLIQVRGEYLPVVSLHEAFNIRSQASDLASGIMVVLEAGGVKAALAVDALIGQQQVVVKNLEANFRKVAGISGATIMGDGRVAMILDVGALVGASRQPLPAAA